MTGCRATIYGLLRPRVILAMEARMDVKDQIVEYIRVHHGCDVGMGKCNDNSCGGCYALYIAEKIEDDAHCSTVVPE